ncbi:hypothetical protein AQUCO_04900095v1 [Aquilegia coerulea]|uniref:F-box domain-containing protein n=1 Tax=Aquilegia coerulea TaxID=218851 RepID=A0A2G5CJR7_AQUCA|nr:hypothetical protein AQUCO_04900095v1 [Aquilegia coerulea]
MMGNLPEDMIINILSRLPVKSLLRFRCVSKPWCSLIDDSDFVKMHLNHAIQKNKFNLLLLSEFDDEGYAHTIDCDTSYTEAIELDFPREALGSSRFIFSGSCNGLLYLHNGQNDIIWNPCTREFKRLPKVPKGREKLDFADEESLYGFGYSEVLDDYKVLKITEFCPEGDFVSSEIMVYTLGTNSWRVIDGAPYSIGFGPQLIGNSNPHWLVSRYAISSVSGSIVCFDLVSEKFGEIEHPQCIGNIVSAGMIGGCLCLLNYLEETRADVWVMKDYGVKESWFKLFTISRSTVIRTLEFLGILCLPRKGIVLLEDFYHHLVLYNLKLKKARNLKVCGVPAKWDETVVYVGSLVSLKSGTYVGQEQLKRKMRQSPEMKAK